MSIKKNLGTIKEEFKNDEKIFMNAFRLEKFFLKYKFFLVGIGVILIVIAVAWRVQFFVAEKNAQAASKLYKKLIQTPEDTQILTELRKKSPDLADFFVFSNAMHHGDEQALESLLKSKNSLIKEITAYQLASLKQDSNSLGNISSSFADLAKFEQSYLLLEKKQTKEAKEILQSIPATSPIKELVNLLSHYQGI